MSVEKGAEDSAGETGGLRAKQREFLETFLKKGTEFTEELIRENERLRFRVAELESSGAPQAEPGSQTATILRELAGRIEALEIERDDLLRRFRRASEESEAVERRFLDIENENTRLASLYVAAIQLHATLDPREVVQVVHEILLNFVGAKTFVLLLNGGAGRPLHRLSSEGVEGDFAIPSDRGVIAEVLRDGRPRLDGPVHGAPLDPLAPSICVPLTLGERTVGAVAVWDFLLQKDVLSDVDTELFRLIGSHAARSLLSARLCADAGTPEPEIDPERLLALTRGDPRCP